MDTSDRGDEEALRAHAAERAAELKQRKIELQTHQAFNPENVELAARRADEAHEWARSAERGAAAAFETAARLHEDVARLHELAAQHRHGDWQHIVTPPAATAKQHRKTARALSANDEKQKTSKVTG